MCLTLRRDTGVAELYFRGLLYTWKLAKRLLPEDATCAVTHRCPPLDGWSVRITWTCDFKEMSLVSDSQCPHRSIVACTAFVLKYEEDYG